VDHGGTIHQSFKLSASTANQSTSAQLLGSSASPINFVHEKSSSVSSSNMSIDDEEKQSMDDEDEKGTTIIYYI